MIKFTDIPDEDPSPECGMCRHWRPGLVNPGDGTCERYPISEHGSNGCEKWEGLANVTWGELALIGKIVIERLHNNSRVIVTRPDNGLRFGVEFETPLE